MGEQDIERYRQMLEEDPRSRAFAPLAEAYRKAGKLDEAIRIAEAGLKIHPGYSGGLVVLGRAHFEKRELDKAAEILQKAVKESPESYLGQKYLGKTLMEKGEIQGALRALEAANLLSPDDEDVAVLVQELRKKATPPKTMEFESPEKEQAQTPEIVTYEQKPTTIDGVELPPLPSASTGEIFSFSEETEGSSPVRAAAPGGGEEMVQTPEDVSLEELGPEVEAFIQEGEQVGEPSFTEPATVMADEDVDLELEDLIEGMEEKEEEEEEEEALPMHQAPPEAPPEPAGPAEEEPRHPVQTGPRVPETGPTGAAAPGEAAPTPVEKPPSEAPAGGSPRPSGPPPKPSQPQEADLALDASSSGAGISTETLADLYAKQGLTDKAIQIYQQILRERPGDEAVTVKLNTLMEARGSGVSGVRSEQPGMGKENAGHGDDHDDLLLALENWLRNAERMKKS
ncbi:MAG: tetratricopeptide repeat protein [bacterium]|nr:MAG: tetratricopeptide repeat protein [bacterium]